MVGLVLVGFEMIARHLGHYVWQASRDVMSVCGSEVTAGTKVQSTVK
jgi:hypothetical protein